MEMISISKAKYEEMVRQIRLLKEIEKIDINLVRQFKNSLDDVKAGRILRVA
ncbi:MAG: hypothetical protein KJ646_05185 [Nanoarchaeota archaeon]|nr:hypothetical protein [Nanoarchaeota archaeon]MBU4116931.1 hypothetical protein [Nanoarchaeota archaeon]